MLDANVLANIHVCGLLLRLAEEPATYQPIWSPDILDEVQRTHLKLGWDQEISDFWRTEIERVFPEAMIAQSPTSDIPQSIDPKDRHVAATGAAAEAKWIVTFNLKDFIGLDQLNIQAIHPSTMLLQIWKANSALVLRRLREYAVKRNSTMPDLLNRLNEWVPEFTAAIVAES